MKNRNIIFIILVFVSLFVFSQKNNNTEELLHKAGSFLSKDLDSCTYYLNKIDSLKTKKAKGYYYFIKANIYVKQSDFNKALLFFKKANNINKYINDTLYINGLHKYGLSCMYLSKYNCAISFFNKEIAIEKQSNLITNTPKAYGNIASAYRRLNKIDSAIFFNKQALKIYQSQADSSRIVSILNNLGNLYQAFDIENSNNYYNKALEISYRIPNMEKRIAIIKENIGINYVATKEYKKALNYLEETYQYFVETKDKMQEAFVLNNIGFCYLNTNQPKKAILFIKKAIDIYQYNSNQEGKIFTLINLADAYYQLKKYKKSKKHYTQALKLANDIKETQLN